MHGFTSTAAAGHGGDYGDLPEEIRRNAVPFESKEQILKAMRDPQYQTDGYYRRLIEVCLSLTPEHVTNPQMTEEPQFAEGEIYDAQRDAARALAKDPRYKTDALFRHQAYQKMAQAEGLTIGQRSSTGTKRVEFSGNGGGVFQETNLGRCTRVELETPEAGPSTEQAGE